MYRIIFSLTAHENIDCLYDIISNIKKVFLYYDITILISLTYDLNENFDNNKFDFVKVVSIRDNTYEMWGNINLFHQHILIIEYIFKNKLEYDFLWFVSSNEMFIKIVPPNFLNNYSMKIINSKDKVNDKDYEIYYSNLLNTENNWLWIELLKKDNYMLNYLYKNKFIINACQHEGLVLPSSIVLELFNEYKNNELHEKSTYKKYVMEEIFMPTYILNKYNIDNFNVFCFRYLYKLGNAKYDEIINSLSEHHLSIKPVKRNYNDIMRTTIRNSL
jgi:hypothetical protein